uniref:Elongation of fatty acids protein n=1 Tax=Trieres chinensis TaxID=1514140 RepID=A0A7S1ZT57_TRICV|mmetsp:Transcript_32526/g.66499  ORF Transcript_32526/g.66499 Transcript_32526/m.66499 type:complete len:299 (+) Transcript_32526:99-995(+)
MDDCVATNGGGVEYTEFSCLYSTLGRTYLGFEAYYDPIPVLKWMQGHNSVPIIACVLYGALIGLGKLYMRDRESWKWRRTLAMWNLGLSVFSWIGMARTLPQLVHNLWTMSLRDNLCTNPEITYGSGSTGLWVQLFVLSKFPELFDTFFIVIHKKPLIFLHWYHHITVLLYCWHSYVSTSPSGVFFVVMNYSVHASMYGYYFLMAMKLKPKWFNPIIITCFQISQMIVGVIVTLLAFYYYNTDTNKESPCQIQKENNVAAFLMYGSYLFLFLQFFIRRYYSVKATTVRPATAGTKKKV